MFDLLAYQAILSSTYPNKFKVEEFEAHQPGAFLLEDKQYRIARKHKFKKTFLKDELKAIKILNFIKEESVDIFFLQEATKTLIEKIER